MRKTILVCLCMFIILHLQAQLKSDTLPVISGETRSFDRTTHMVKYAQILNNLKDTQVLPKFITDPCYIDRQNRKFQDTHLTTDFRLLIVTNVTNISVIRRIIKAKAANKKCAYAVKFLYYQNKHFTYKDYFKIRLQELIKMK